MKLAVNYGPYHAAAQKIASDPELVAKLTALQHTYPKAIPEIVVRICCEYYRDELPKLSEATNYGVFAPGAPLPEVIGDLMLLFRARKKRGVRISESVCEALRLWLNTMVAGPNEYGGILWSDSFHASHTGGQPFAIIKDPAEMANLLAFRKQQMCERLAKVTGTNPTSVFDIFEPPVV